MQNTSTASNPSVRFQLRAERVLDWLAGDRFLDDTFRPDRDDLPDEIQILVTQAQIEGVLALPDHRLELWQVADHGFLLTLDSPHPPRLCSHHLRVSDLLPDKASGIESAYAILRTTVQVANQLLNERDHAATRRVLPAGLLPAPTATSGLLAAPSSVTHPTAPTGADRPHRR